MKARVWYATIFSKTGHTSWMPLADAQASLLMCTSTASRVHWIELATEAAS